MVLTELGVKLTGALRKLNASTVITDDVLKDVLKDICRALMESDVAIQVGHRSSSAVAVHTRRGLRLC